MTGTFVRNKDGVMATLLICEMAAYYQTLNMTLCDVLQMLYQEYGYFLEALESRTFEGKEGIKRIENIINAWRTKIPKQIGSYVITKVCDYDKRESYDLLTDTRSKLDLPKENVLYFTLDDDFCLCLRPSGTDPKMKVYFSVRDKTYCDARKKLKQLVHEVMSLIDDENIL